MILVILAISILMVVGGFILFDIEELLGGVVTTIGIIAFIISIIALISLWCNVTNLRTIDARIEMYQEENSRIETQVAEAVANYQKHESDVFTEVSPESSMTLVALYPELKSDALVSKQIEVYIENNEEIKALREKKIQGTVSRWWLYFGR